MQGRPTLLCACHLFAEPVEVLHQPEERRKQEGKEERNKKGRKKGSEMNTKVTRKEVQ